MVFGDPNDEDPDEFLEFLEEQGLPPMTKKEYLIGYCAEDMVREREESRIASREYLV